MNVNTKKSKLTAIEICAGAGGQALGLERAGFEHAVLVEIDQHCCNTLRLNRPNWNVVQADLNNFDGSPHKGVDLVAGGVPCPPFSKAGKQLGSSDERDLFPAALRLVKQTHPKAVMIENVRGLLDPKFASYRDHITKTLETMDYKVSWKLLNASHFGVPQLRLRTLMVALKEPYAKYFEWPKGKPEKTLSVGEVLHKSISSLGWKKADEWKALATRVAPTIVGGSKKHGGADLGPTRARAAWATMGVDAKGIVELAPAPDFEGNPRLTLEMASLIQGFPPEWKFTGKKTAAYKQIGNAFPAPVAEAVGRAIHRAISQGEAVSSHPNIQKDTISSVARAS